jgi:chromosome segregation ATPase
MITPPKSEREAHLAHDALQDAQMAAILVSIRSLTEQMAEVTTQQHLAARELQARSAEIADIRQTVRANAQTAKDVLELFETLRGGFRVLGWLGVGFKAALATLGALVALWAAYKQIGGK